MVESDVCEFSINIECENAYLKRVYRPPFPFVCPFYIEMNNTFFPNRDWNDFVVPILTEWLKKVALEEEGKEMDLNFMDGSYFIRLIPQDEKIKILLISILHSKDKVIGETILEYECLRSVIYKAAKKLSIEVSLANIRGSDYACLADVVSRYEKIRHNEKK